MKRTNSGLLFLVASLQTAFAQPTGTWIGCPWEGTPAAINEVVVWDADDPAADLNGDGVRDFFDVQVLLNAFADGCP